MTSLEIYQPPDDEPEPVWVIYWNSGRPGCRWEVKFRGPEEEARTRWLYEQAYQQYGNLVIYDPSGRRVAARRMPPAP
jgi:hypothetical protein